jgi:hypothetical protein
MVQSDVAKAKSDTRASPYHLGYWPIVRNPDPERVRPRLTASTLKTKSRRLKTVDWKPQAEGLRYVPFPGVVTGAISRNPLRVSVT